MAVETSTATTRRHSGAHRERPCAGSEIDDKRLGAHAVATEDLDVLGRIEPGRAVIAGHVSNVEGLRTRVSMLVQPPAPHRPTPP
jgi:hypothetical protein